MASRPRVEVLIEFGLWSLRGMIGMRAVLLEDYGVLKLIETHRPELTGQDQVLVRTSVVGVCGSEIHAFNGSHPFREPPAVMGHEIVGIVAEAGSDCSSIKPGDRVTVDPQWTCGTCSWCTSGRHNLCPKKTVLGTTGWSGGFGEYFVIPENRVYPLPPGMSDSEAILIEPLSVGMHASRRAAVRDGEKAVVFGSGTIGLSTIAAARVYGAATVVAVDLLDHCLIAATSAGATAAVHAGAVSADDQIRSYVGKDGADVVFVTIGIPAVFEKALSLVRPGGRIAMIALFDKPVSFEPFDIVGSDVSILGSQMYSDIDVKDAISALVEGRAAIQHLVTHELPIEEARKAFDLTISKKDNAIKVVLLHR